MMKKKRNGKQVSEYTDSLLDGNRSNSRHAEAYRTLRTNILFSNMGKRVRSILFTSAGESEGKTITTANLAFTLSKAGKRVLVIDADLRKPMLSRLLKKQRNRGLTGVLTDMINTDIRSGSLADFSVEDLIQLIAFQKRTGVLRLDDGGEQVRLTFSNGRMSDIEWKTRPEEKNLARVLMKNGTLSKENAKLVLDRQKDTGQKLAYILVNMGLMKEDELRGIMRLRTAESFQVTAHMKNGSFSFSDEGDTFQMQDGAQASLFSNINEFIPASEGNFLFLKQLIDNAVAETEVAGQYLLGSGSIPPNPSELLGSEQMGFALRYLSRRFDYVLADSPPMLPASDALLLAPNMDGVALVVKAGNLNRKMVMKAVDQLRRTRSHLLGVILNRVDAKREDYYQYYQKYYGHYSSQLK